jgi:hypothetical protein
MLIPSKEKKYMNDHHKSSRNTDTVAYEISSVDFVTISQFSLRVYAQSPSIKRIFYI